MEKLQAAIERARAQRDGATVDRDRPVRTPPDGEAPSSDTPWSQLKMLNLTDRTTSRGRIFLDPRMPESAYYDKLRTKVIQQCRDNGWRRILVTSATRGCGKTTTCLNLAASFARQKDRTLLVLEFDMRRPEMARILRHRDTAGWGEILDGEARFEDHAVRMSDNVIIAMNHGPHPTPSRTILADATIRRIEEIEKQYQPDFVLIDTPPLLATDDTLALLKSVDCALLMAGSEKTTIGQLDVIEKEVSAITNVMGVVLNACRYTDAAYGSGYDPY